MRVFDVRAAACALGAMERPRGDRISIWCYDAAPEVFQCIRVENRNPAWVAYIPPRLLESDIAHSLRYRESDGVVRYRVSFGGLVYLGEGRCLDTGSRVPGAIPCRALAPTASEFFREWTWHAWASCRRFSRDLSQSAVNAVAAARKFRPLARS